MLGAVKMSSLQKRSILFYKYLLSYIIIFLVPFILISTFFYKMSVDNLQEEITQTNIEKIEQVKDFTDTRMEELKNIATRISMDPDVTPYMMKRPFESKQAISELASYKVNSAIIDDLLLYYPNDPYIYSTRGTSTLRNFMNNMYFFNENDQRKLVKDLQSTTEPAIYPVRLASNPNKHMIAYLFPIPPSDSTTYGSVLFLIQETKFKELIQNLLGEFNGSIFVFNENDKLLTSQSSSDTISQDVIRRAALEQSGVIEKQLNHENYSLVTVKSDVTGWSFVTAVPTEQFNAKMSNLKQLTFLILSLILIIGIGLCIYLTKRQYKPIQGIFQLLQRKNGDTIQDSVKLKQDFDGIRQSIEVIYENKENLEKKVEEQKRYVRAQFLLKLLKGNGKDEEWLNKLTQELNLSFSNQIFCVKVFFDGEIVGNEALLMKEQVLNWLADVSFKACRGYGVELISENALVLIVNIDNQTKNPEERRKEFSGYIMHHLQHFQMLAAVGVGTLYSKVEKINRSFIEATACIEYNLVKIPGAPIFFENISLHKDDVFWYSEADYIKLVQSLKQGDRTVAKETVSTILATLAEKEISFQILKFICYDVSNVILKNSVYLGIIHQADTINHLNEFWSLQDLEKKLHDMIDKICDEVERREENDQQDFRGRIVEFIHTNFSSHELSLEQTAKAFHVSVSYLSRFIKEQTGKTFSQYVWSLRNEEFKRQLVETDKSIKNIVLQIGYIDVSNFTRKFKQKEGITPLQYRKQYRYKNWNTEGN